MSKTDPESGGTENESVGVSIPDDHVGAFVAEVFEDVERDTTWEQVVSALVAEEAREEWNELSAREQIAAVLSTAADYDERAADRLAGIPTDRGKPTPEIREEYDEAMRCRRNADQFRDGVAAAYAEGVVGDDELVAAVEEGEFDAGVVAEREDELDRVANAFDFDYRPYGGTLMHDEDGESDEENPLEDFEAW
ncbi:hypothetical protein M0R88_04705 [Halorussus gelatinilyticus]|uniref:Uncharacterized protein n=1 Tax=Halorussus gelatinilyticus TaxID=2937524 RepID=A0A8U0IMI6_9EURY|nr:hypothetical protein [Halorussus gelatinilyticus]UPW01404.1 hypothetical protein M0R88_04705 [Halorussus gelatinilyticus]